MAKGKSFSSSGFGLGTIVACSSEDDSWYCFIMKIVQLVALLLISVAVFVEYVWPFIQKRFKHKGR